MDSGSYREFRQYIFTILFGWISFWIGFSIGHDIVLLMGGTVVEGLIIGIISGIISGVIVSLSTYRFINYLEFQKRHKKKLWEEILTKLVNLSRPVYNDFNIKLDVIDKENTDEFIWAFQHLRRKHSNISTNYGLVETHAKKLNNELLNDFKGYTENKIKDSIVQMHVAKLTGIISEIIKSIFQKNINKLEDIEFKLKEGKCYIYVSSINHREISSNEYQFLSKLLKENTFKCKIKEIQEEGGLLNEAFDWFKKGLNELIKKIEDDGVNELKGKCEKCSFWKDC